MSTECKCCHAGTACPCCELHLPDWEALRAYPAAHTEGLPDGSQRFNPVARQTYLNMAQISVDRALNERRLTLSHMLDLKAAEALLAAAEGDSPQLRANLLSLAAICLAGVRGIDKRSRQ